MSPDYATVAEFLRRLGHPVALIGRKPVDSAPSSMVIWPIEQDDAADQACCLSQQYHAVYANLNPLASYMLDVMPDRGRSVSDDMIARRTRLLIDVDAHDAPKELARDQKDAIKARYGAPLIETDSGNGYGLIYAIDYPNDADAKHRIKILLERLKAEFSCVDTSTFNSGRLTRVIGTLNKSSTGERINTCLL